MPRTYVLSISDAQYWWTSWRGLSWWVLQALECGFAGVQVSSDHKLILREIEDAPQPRPGVYSIQQSRHALPPEKDPALATMLSLRTMRDENNLCVVRARDMDVSQFSERHKVDLVVPLNTRTFHDLAVFNSFYLLGEKVADRGYAGFCLHTSDIGRPRKPGWSEEHWKQLLCDPSQIKLLQIRPESKDELREIQGLPGEETGLRRIQKDLAKAGWQGQVVLEIPADLVAAYQGKWSTIFMRPDSLMKIYRRALAEVRLILCNQWIERAAVKA